MLDFSRVLKPNCPLIHPTSQIRKCTFGQYVELGDHCLLEETQVGAYSYCFGYNDIIYANIGKFNSIATGVRINPVQHPAKTRAAAHHFTYRCSHYSLGPDDERILAWRREKRVVTGHDVWIGYNAVIMGGVTIGHGGVVGAGAVVTHDVAPYEIVGGVPARHIGWRYPPQQIEALLRIRWWDWEHEALKSRLGDFDDVEAFCRKYDMQYAGTGKLDTSNG